MPDITDVCSICQADVYSTAHYNWNTGKEKKHTTTDNQIAKYLHIVVFFNSLLFLGWNVSSA